MTLATTPANLFRESMDVNAGRFRRRDIAERAFLSNDYDIPLTKLLGGLDAGREKFGFVGPPTDTKYEWMYDGPLPVATTLAVAIASAPTSLGNDSDGNPVYADATVTLANINYIHKGMILELPVPVGSDPNADGAILANELWWVVSVNYAAGTAVVKPGYANTPVYAYAQHTKVTIHSTAGLEDQGWVANYQTRRGSVENYWQLFFAGWKDTKFRQMFQSNYGDSGDELERTRSKIIGGTVGDVPVTGLLPLQLENAIMYGQKYRGNPVAEFPSTFGGITSFPINKPVYNTTLTYDNVMSTLQTIYEKGGAVDLMVCSPAIKKIVSGWAMTNRETYGAQRVERSYGVIVDRIETDFGNLDVVMSRHMRPAEAFLLDTAKMGLLTGESWTESVLAETDTPLIERTMYHGIFGFALTHPEHHAWIRVDASGVRWTGGTNLYTEPAAVNRVYPGTVIS